jgi:L-alanine-DL-glutamate epimerase-like enolase superfamily enzyme
MKITQTDIFKFSIPMEPFTIATGTMHFAQNIFIRVRTDEKIYGVGECSAFPMITGESQATCFEMAKEFGKIWKNKNFLQIEERMAELEDCTAFNSTIKSAFDMALFDLASKNANLPLYKFLNGKNKLLESDLTIGIGTPEKMAATATDFKKKGVRIIKIKLGKNGEDDIERVRRIRNAVGPDLVLRIDANQGWDFNTALYVLTELKDIRIEFCEQPMRYWNDHILPELRRKSPVPIMADESVYDYHDALRLINNSACDYVNIKFAKSGGILGAMKINKICAEHDIPCMMGGMLESRIALSAFAHYSLATDNIRFYDMDTCLLGHLEDPAIGGVRFNGLTIEVPDTPGIGADADEKFLSGLEQISI